MESQKLRRIVEDSNDKLSVFANISKLDLKFDFYELLKVITEVLNEEEKMQLLTAEYLRKLAIHPNVRQTPDCIALEIIPTLSNHAILQILQDSSFKEKYDFSVNTIESMIEVLNKETRVNLLLNTDFIKTILLGDNYIITEIIKSLEDESIQLNMIDIYNLNSLEAIEIIKDFSDESKKSILLKEKYDFSKGWIVKLVSTMAVKSIISFLMENKDFFVYKDISCYEIVKNLDSEEQLKFMGEFENIDLTIRRKKTNLSNAE